jgi:hypothetical protein
MILFSLIHEEMGPLNQALITTCHFTIHDPTPFISILLYCMRPHVWIVVDVSCSGNATTQPASGGVFFLLFVKEDHISWHMAP